MKPCFVILLLVFIHSLSAKVESTTCVAKGVDVAGSSDAAERILGAVPAPIPRYPYAASVKALGIYHECGAVLIHPRWLLTAASCISIEKGLLPGIELQVEIGGYFLNSDDGEIRTGIARLHPKWGESGGDPLSGHDIALIKLTKPSTGSPVCLPASASFSKNLKESDLLTTLGWGRTTLRSGFATELQHATALEFISPGICNLILSGTKNVLCAGELQGPCPGDQGGPLVKPGKTDILVGITTSAGTYAFNRCGDQVPGIFTDVSKNLEWILAEMKKG